MEEIIKNTKEEIVLEIAELEKTINTKVYEFATNHNLMVLHTSMSDEDSACCAYLMYAWEKEPILNPSGFRKDVKRLSLYAGTHLPSVEFRLINDWIQQELIAISKKHNAIINISSVMKDDGIADMCIIAGICP